MRRYWLPTCLVVAGLAAGFVLGRATAGKGAAEPAAAREVSVAGATGRRNEPRGEPRGNAGLRHGGRETTPEAVVRRVARLLDQSPMVGMDYDILFGAYEAIRSLSPAELRAVLDDLDEMLEGVVEHFNDQTAARHDAPGRNLAIPGRSPKPHQPEESQ